MEVKAKVNRIRISPRKTRLVVDVIRGLRVSDAYARLSLLNKKATTPILKLLKSAVSNAEHNFNLDANNLIIKEIRVDGGAILYRWMPKAQGRATPIRKRTSMVSVVLQEKGEGQNNTISKDSKKLKAVKTEKGEDKKMTKVKEVKKKVNSHLTGKKVGGRAGLTKANSKKVFRRKAGM